MPKHAVRILSLLLLVPGLAQGQKAEPAPTYKDHVQPLLRKHCLNCHNPDKARSDLDVKPARVDYLSQVRIAQQAEPQGGGGLVYPSGLPSGWYVTSLTFSPDGTRPGIEMSMLTPDDYVGMVQSTASVAELLTTYVDPHPQAGPPVHVPGSVVPRWATWTDPGGDTALAARHGRESLLVFGTAPQRELEQLAASLTTAPVAG